MKMTTAIEALLEQPLPVGAPGGITIAVDSSDTAPSIPIDRQGAPQGVGAKAPTPTSDPQNDVCWSCGDQLGSPTHGPALCPACQEAGDMYPEIKSVLDAAVRTQIDQEEAEYCAAELRWQEEQDEALWRAEQDRQDSEYFAACAPRHLLDPDEVETIQVSTPTKGRPSITLLPAVGGAPATQNIRPLIKMVLDEWLSEREQGISTPYDAVLAKLDRDVLVVEGDGHAVEFHEEDDYSDIPAELLEATAQARERALDEAVERMRAHPFVPKDNAPSPTTPPPEGDVRSTAMTAVRTATNKMFVQTDSGYRCQAGHVFSTIAGTLPLTCPHCNPAHPCPNCGGAHRLARCSDFLAALANPGAAIWEAWERDRENFLMQWGAWSEYEAMATAEALASWLGSKRGTPSYWMRRWTDALAEICEEQQTWIS